MTNGKKVTRFDQNKKTNKKEITHVNFLLVK